MCVASVCVLRSWVSLHGPNKSVVDVRVCIVLLGVLSMRRGRHWKINTRRH